MPMDVMGIVVSTCQVVVAPTFLDVGSNAMAPKFCKAVTPYTPIGGAIATVLLGGASVAKCAKPILGAELPLQLACLLLPCWRLSTSARSTCACRARSASSGR